MASNRENVRRRRQGDSYIDTQLLVRWPCVRQTEVTAFYLALALIKQFEGCRLHAYQDIAGVWTIGWGETLGVTEGMVWTQEHADMVLKRRLAYFMAEVLKRCPQLHFEHMTRFAACTSLAYNIGLGAFGVSSVCRYTKRKDYAKAANSFLLWNKSGGAVRRGLVIRRQLERGSYLK